MVFFLGGIPSGRTRHPGGVNAVFCDGSVRFVRDTNEIIAALGRTATGNTNTIIIGPATQPGFVATSWLLTPGSKQVPSLGLTNGGNAILIGLLLPAVQAAREAAKRKAPQSPEIEQLKAMTGPGGHVFVMGSEGELLPA
jgi:prepilin-type processing-associated H-X9-DG protein